MKQPFSIEQTAQVSEAEEPEPSRRRTNIMSKNVHKKAKNWRRFFSFLSRKGQETKEITANKSFSSKLVSASPTLPNQQMATHHVMVENVVRLHEARVDDVMIDRSEIEALELGTTLSEALLFFAKSGHSRLPVYAQTLDDPRGMVHIRDLLSFITKTACGFVQNTAQDEQVGLDFSLVNLNQTLAESGVIREVLFVPASMRASQLLSRMQSTRIQMALVIDEYGGTDGLASMEDVFELVVGDIEDEHDDDDERIVAEGADCWLVDARAELEEIAQIIGNDIDWGDLGEDVDTIGGLIVSRLDYIPSRGESVEFSGYGFHVVEADHRRIRRVRIKKLLS